MERIPRQIVVRNKETGRIGVTCDDLPVPLTRCTPQETPVVYGGEATLTGITTELLEIIGPENAKAEPDRCGAGREEECCVFLVLKGGKFECQRFGSLRWDLISLKEGMNAKREPVKSYPFCQFHQPPRERGGYFFFRQNFDFMIVLIMALPNLRR